MTKPLPHTGHHAEQEACSGEDLAVAISNLTSPLPHPGHHAEQEACGGEDLAVAISNLS